MTQYTYLMAMEKLKAGDSINLLDMKNLSYPDLDKLFEDIKFWKIHGNHEFNIKRIVPPKSLLEQKTYFALDFKSNPELTSLPLTMEEESLMNLTINSRDLEVTPAMRKHVEDGMQKIRKHFDHVIDATVFFMIDNATEKALRHTAELTIHLKGKELFAEAQNKDLYHAIDDVLSKLERQVVKHKEKIQNHHHEKLID
ncbi:MAG: ribosome-associated translation inhibitor RaiA [Betaproteobacteria bacterium]